MSSPFGSLFSSPSSVISSLLARRYLSYPHTQGTIVFMRRLCFAGITIGTAALMLTLVITNGFQKVIHEKMQGLRADIIISAPGNKLDADELIPVIKELSPLVSAVAPSSTRHAIIDQAGRQMVIFLRGIHGPLEALVSTLGEKLTAGSGDVVTKSEGNEQLSSLQGPRIMIGAKLAAHLGLAEGDQLTLLIPEATGKRRIALSKSRVTIHTLFSIGLEEYDMNIAFVDLAFLQELFDEQGVDQLCIKFAPAEHKNEDTKQTGWLLALSDAYEKVKNRIATWFGRPSPEEQVLQHLRASLPHLRVNSWQDLYPDLVASLVLEKYVMFFVIGLISLVACMNMISLLSMQIEYKRRDIAILKAMGTPDTIIRRIFIRMGLRLTAAATITGLAIAAAAGLALEKYPFIQLPDVYYVSHLPARVEWELFLIVFLVTLAMGLVATLIPAANATKLRITSVLRHES